MSSQLDFIVKIAPSATSDYRKTGLLASVTIAQACLESSYGTSELAKNACNLFGMKQTLSGKVWPGETYTKLTTEQDTAGNTYKVTAPFRKYDSYASSIADHTEYLTTAKNGTALRYKGLTDAKTPIAQATIIKNGGYATDTQYVAKLIAVITSFNLTQYDTKEVAKTGYPMIQCNSTNFRSGRRDTIKYIVIHYTANNGDTAENNGNYFKNNSNLSASAHYFVDEDSICQSVADADTAWHCGATTYKHATCRNDNSIGVELCSRKDAAGKYYFKAETVTNAVKLVKELMAKYSVPASNVLRHYDVTGKNCPAPFVEDESQWAAFKVLLSGGPTPITRYAKSALNVRAGAGTNYAVKVTLAAGEAVTWPGKSTTVDGVKWAFIVTSKNVTGWVNATYLRA